MNPLLLLTQLLPLPLVWAEVVSFEELSFAYGLEAGALATVHAVLLLRRRSRGWQWLVATTTPVLGVAFAVIYLSGDSTGDPVSVPVAAATAAALLAGAGLVWWRQDLGAAIGTGDSMTWRLGPLAVAFALGWWLELAVGSGSEGGRLVEAAPGVGGALSRDLIDLAATLDRPVDVLLAVVLVGVRAANEVLTEAWDRLSTASTDAVNPR